MSWWEWLNIAVLALLVTGMVAWLWARRYERREQQAARRRREQRLSDWQLVELPGPPQAFPEPGTTKLDSDLVSRLCGGDEFEELRHFFAAYFHQDMGVEYDDQDDAVRGYVEDHAHLPNDVVEMLHGMDTLLVLGLNDDDVQEALDALGSGYYPAADTTVWLRSLREKVLTEAKGG